MRKKNWSLLKILGIYVGAILIVPFVVRKPDVNNLVRFYLQPLGNLKASFITFSGASIGSFIAIMGAVWIQDRNKKSARYERSKKECSNRLL